MTCEMCSFSYVTICFTNFTPAMLRLKSIHIQAPTGKEDLYSEGGGEEEENAQM